MTYIPLLALTVLTATATEPRYDLNILFNNGQTTVIPVEDIESIEFIHTDAGPTDPNFSNIPRGTMLQPDLTPGFSGSFFAPGVSATEGFVDVDKFGTSGPYGDDNSCCWMCAAADLIQWWLNDYKSWTGRDFRLNAELPSPSLYNGVAVMDAMMQAYNNTGGGDSYEAVGWFLEGVTRNSILNDVKTFNEAYPQWRGGFGGFTHERLRDLYVVQDETFGYAEPRYHYYQSDDKTRNLTASEIAVAFTRNTIEALQEGPIQMCTRSHALACFGIDYTVDSQGNPVMTRMYIVDNDPVEGNVKNGYNMATPHFKDGGVVWISLASAYNGGYDPVTRIIRTFGIRSVRFMNCEK